MTENKENNKKEKPEKENLNRFIKYSTLGFEMMAMIGLGTWAGVSLDKYFENSTPGFTIGLSLFSIFASLYLVIKRVMNDK
ncbi:MAG: AtpZ/AtpI family protein [Bacteroidales bacterium]|nr:AtpZ/AtpI family protein [Bacteroidales bacterium]MCK9499420.1 AtpZ/AtpI family protein [Bacteroidales bacterium]MDY0315008.1 AtpZ/AtpI family protein [Bacteroidales bacterium]